MKICGIVAEYDPFHNGHKYQIEEAKAKTNCDAIVAIMSGNFLQRGIPASFDKFTRAKMAIENGIDVVIELPACYATASSEFFASGAIGILESLNSISNISFGAECDNIELLSSIADILKSEPDKYKEILQKHLKKGISYPKARASALTEYINKIKESPKCLKDYSNSLDEILLSPNNILAIEYLKALKHYNSNISPIPILRKGSDYNSIALDNSTSICSSTAIREALSKDLIENIKNFVPNYTYETISKEYKIGKNQIKLKDFEKEIFYKLRNMDNYEISQIADVSEGLENIIEKCLLTSFDIDSLLTNLKSKRYTLTRIQRILIHALLNIKGRYIQNEKYTPQYARVIATSKNGKKVLAEIAKNSTIPVVTNVAKFMKEANDKQKEMLEKDILASNIYTMAYNIPEFRKMNLDYTTCIFSVSQ